MTTLKDLINDQDKFRKQMDNVLADIVGMAKEIDTLQAQFERMLVAGIDDTCKFNRATQINNRIDTLAEDYEEACEEYLELHGVVYETEKNIDKMLRSFNHYCDSYTEQDQAHNELVEALRAAGIDN